MKRRNLFIVTALFAIMAVSGCEGNSGNGAESVERTSRRMSTADDASRALQAADNLIPENRAPLAPNWTMRDLEGIAHSLSDYRGKVVILDFWDTWSPPCKKEIPGFVKLQEVYGDKGLVVIGTAFARDGIRAVEEFADKWKMNYPVIIIEPGVAESYGGIRSVPTTFVIDREGRARAMHIGYVDSAVFEAEILALL